ncbi:MAG: hypothetical protein JWP00_4555 [Chloroflexi bacterium]|nr:hypothetical protein [Chloroflexota bacterium]
MPEYKQRLLEFEARKQSDPVTNNPATGRCPVSGKPGKAVQIQTVKALLKVSLRSVRNTEHFFCADKDCPVVYFTADGTQTFRVDELRERVYQKEPDNLEVPVCYCFQHTSGNIRAATADHRQAILADIKAGIKAEQCVCDLRNPQGACCLGNVSKLIRQLEKS